MLVAELDVLVDEIADSLNATPAGGRLVEERPSHLRKAGRSRSSDSPARYTRVSSGRSWTACSCARCSIRSVVPGSLTIESALRCNFPLRSDDPAAPVAKPVAVCLDRGGRVNDERVGSKQVGDARIVNAQRQDHGSGFRAVVNDVVTNPEFHVEAPGSPMAFIPSLRSGLNHDSTRISWLTSTARPSSVFGAP